MSLQEIFDIFYSSFMLVMLFLVLLLFFNLYMRMYLKRVNAGRFKLILFRFTSLFNPLVELCIGSMSNVFIFCRTCKPLSTYDRFLPVFFSYHSQWSSIVSYFSLESVKRVVGVG